MAMVTTHDILPHDDLLDRYLDALERRGVDGDPDEDVRTCHRCGERSTFTTAREDGWARCDACGHEA
jgi:hypothetical protein